MFYDSLTLADTSGAVEAVVHGGLPRPGGRRLPDCVAARGSPQEVSSAIDCWKSKISHFPGKSRLLEPSYLRMRTRTSCTSRRSGCAGLFITVVPSAS